jgi:plastocyanin
MPSRLVLLCLALALEAACGGSSPSSPGPPPQTGPTITISSGGVSPKDLSVSPGARVLFVNNDSRPHDMASDPHPDHDDCREINGVRLNPGQSRETGNLVEVRTCGFHDHDNPDNNGLQGRITIR